ncbi:MAG: hypothetical protein IPP90_13035 [Gemmatimonadaceae bacterium]|nr:hypothetical protein [Gemmatimonadaceae bacterium]
MNAENSTTEKGAQAIVGGMFGLPELQWINGRVPGFLDDASLMLANASCGLWLLARELNPGRIWMPSYLCESMVTAIHAAGREIQFYEVGYDLHIPNGDWLERIRPEISWCLSIISDSPWTKRWQPGQEPMVLVSSQTRQALLSDNAARDSDFLLFSPRKFLGVPDGGLLRCNSKVISRVRLNQAPVAWTMKVLEASVLRREFDRHGGSRRWFDLRRQADSEQPIGAYAMSQLTENLLRFGFDYEEISRKRIENYGRLLEDLREFALFSSMPAGVVPLGFPIRVAHRDRVRQELFDHAIYPPIHWPIDNIVPPQFSESHRLAAEILTLPCDQRYSRADMARIASITRHAGTGS